jgi:transposase
LKASFLFVSSAQNGLTSAIGQQHLMSGQISAVWNIFLSLSVVAALLIGGTFSDLLEDRNADQAVRILFLVGAAIMASVAVYGTWKPSRMRKKSRHWPDLGYNPRRVTRCGGRPMRGWDERSDALFSYVSCEARVPKDHPLRPIQRIVDEALAALSPEFEKLYARFGRPSIPPERLLRALLLQAFYSVRSEKQLMEQLDYNLLFRWFVGLSLDANVWDETVFTKNRDRLIEGDIARKFMAAVLSQGSVKALLSDDHFSVDGTLIEAWASMKSFRPKDGSGEPPAAGRNGERDFHGEKRSNETHASTTDPDARLYRKGPGQPAKLAYLGHVLMENRHALVVDTRLTLATGTAEREAALEMAADRPGRHRITLGADKAYDVAEFVADLREHNVTPHVAQNTTNRRSAIDRRTTRHPGYAVSGRLRKRVEEVFGWTKAAAGFRKTHHRGLARVGWIFTLTATAYNLVRLTKLVQAEA